uniref:Uncharacterized protein n=1 Tax=viral metagenome TaxID=1070528 RepID=A0A6C0HT93_9ZZZZ
MFELIAFFLFVSQIQNISLIYAVEIQLFKQKLQNVARTFRNKTVNLYHSWYTYFYPEQKTIKKESPIVIYENKYKEKFLTIEGDRKTNLNNILFEATPNGNVIMFYNSEKARFEFYSDKTIPFRFLETVARKYVIVFQCKNIYIEQTNGKNKKTNVFSHLGKLANYSFLQKVEKHVTNKKMIMSFKEFKNMKL